MARRAAAAAAQPEPDDAVAAGLADVADNDDADAVVEQPEVIDVDTSREKPDDDAREPDPDNPTRTATVTLLPVKHEPTSLMPLRDELRGVAEMAVSLAMAEVVPKALRGKPANVLAVILTGRELGVSPMTAIRTFHVIDGTVTVAPKVRLAMVRQQGLGKVWPDENNGDEEATWYAERKDTPGIIFKSRYGVADARKVKMTLWVNGNKKASTLDQKDNWQNYPARMCSWRCLPDRAEALTRTGWAAPEKLTAGDEILGYDVETNTLRWTEITRISRYAAAQTYRIEHSAFTAIATAEHRWFVEHYREPGERTVRSTADLHVGQYQLIVAAPADDQPSDVTDDQAAILGWLLTDGHWRWRGNSPTATISQTKHVDVLRRLLPDVHETLRAASTSTIRGGIVRSRPNTLFRLPAPFTRSLLECVGIRSKDDAAMIPAQLSASGRAAIFEAMMLANGTRRKRGGDGVFRTGHRSVLDCFVILATMLGYRLGREQQRRPGCWEIAFHGTHRTVSAKNLSIVEHDIEPVWCPTTTLGSWVARLDGYTFVTGNSLGYLLDDAFPEVGTGLYSPDELGAVTDDDGQPILDVESTEAIVPAHSSMGSNRGKPREQAPKAPSAHETPADPAVLAKFRERIDVISKHEGGKARAALLGLWTKRNDDGTQRLPPLDSLTQAQCKAASAIIDQIERRIGKGDTFDDVEPPAGADEQRPATAAQEPQEAVEPAGGGDTPAEAPEAVQEPSEPVRRQPRLDVSGLPAGTAAEDDLRWLANSPDGLVDEIAAAVKDMPADAVNARLEELSLATTGKDDAKRARLAARLVRRRMEDMAL